MSDALKKLPLEPSTADHLLSNMDHCVYSYTCILELGYFDSPFLATLTFLEVSMTALKLREGRDGQKTGPKLVLCSSFLLEKVVDRDTVTSNLSVWYSVLTCFPLGLICVYICMYIHTCVSKLTFPTCYEEEGSSFFSPSK